MSPRRKPDSSKPRWQSGSDNGDMSALEAELHAKQPRNRQDRRSAERAEADSLARPSGRFIGRPVA